jgi:hypothetical protein
MMLALLFGGAAVGQDVRDRPAEFRISDEVVAGNPGRYTATFADGPINVWLNAGYEPIHFRTKLHLIGDSPNELIVEPSAIDGHNSYKSGLWDGARARVYRVRDGKLALVRVDVVAEHHASGWHQVEGYSGKLVAPTQTAAEFVLPGWWAEDVDQWLTVVAVSKDGSESAPAEATRVRVPARPKEMGQPKLAESIAAPRERGKLNEALASPRNVRVSVDEKSRVFSISWDAVDSPDLLGFALRISDYPPEQHRGLRLMLKNSPDDPALHLKRDDMVFLEKQFTSFSRRDRLSNRIFGANQNKFPSLIPFESGGEMGRWSLAPHPKPLPDELRDGGETCLSLDLTTDRPVEIRRYNFGHLEQSWYRVLDPKKTYIVEFWARQEGLADPTATFQFRQASYRGENEVKANFQLAEQWQKHRAELRVPFMLERSGPIGEMVLSFRGPGKVWLDNLRVYESGAEFCDFFPEDYAELERAKLEALRTHSHIKSPLGYSMQMLTNAPGSNGFSGTEMLSAHTLASWLRIFEKAKVNPWLQIEMCMDESEWLGLVEYLNAPYDPAVDTPEKKPWAYKRYRQGRTEPWTNAFSKIYFEISNETWNPLFRPWIFNWLKMTDEVTGRRYESGELYGLFQEHVLQTMRSSPYWTAELDRKFEAVLGGWAIQTDDKGYGQQAARTSPSSKHVTIAAYNGGWDEKEPPAEANDDFRFKALSQTVQQAIPRADQLVAWLHQHNAANRGQAVLGTYEAGPGYNLNGLNNVRMTPKQVEAESQVMKSLAGGTATLDSFLARGERGFVLQNFFTFSRNRHYWTSHAPLTSGGQAYPCWSLLALCNREGQGDFLKVETVSVPTADLTAPERSRRASVKDAPLVACYATRCGDRCNVFVLSRRIDAATPVTLNLPFKSARSITLHRTTGSPSDHNLDAEKVKIETVPLPADALKDGRLTIDGGLPPAASYLFVFEGAKP